MNNTAQYAEYSFNSIKQRKPHHEAWGAFQAGMQFLQKYAGRSPGNSENIAISNLRLLHQSLLKDPNYTQSLKKASERIASNCLPSSQCIFNDKGLRADLLTLKSGTTIQLTSHQNSCAMYLSITGKPSINLHDNTQSENKDWWDRYRWPNHEQSINNGDAVLISPQKQTKKLLTAKKNKYVLLRIQL